MSGKTEAINLTAAQYLNEANNSDENTTSAMIAKTDEEREADEALKAMEKVPSLQEQINPLLEKISAGLSGMSKIVGGSTKPQDVTPGTLATFLSTTLVNSSINAPLSICLDKLALNCSPLLNVWNGLYQAGMLFNPEADNLLLASSKSEK